jgi:hypothetical protein
VTKKGNFLNLKEGWVGAIIVVEEESSLVCFVASTSTWLLPILNFGK